MERTVHSDRFHSEIDGTLSSITVSHKCDGFNVELVFNGSWTQSQKDMAALQAEILSDIITGDLANSGDVDDVRPVPAIHSDAGGMPAGFDVRHGPARPVGVGVGEPALVRRLG